MIDTSNLDVSGTVTVAQMSSSTDDALNLEIAIKYACPDLQTSNFAGLALLTLTLKFEGCDPISISWNKSCGRDTITKMSGLSI